MLNRSHNIALFVCFMWTGNSHKVAQLIATGLIVQPKQRKREVGLGKEGESASNTVWSQRTCLSRFVDVLDCEWFTNQGNSSSRE